MSAEKQTIDNDQESLKDDQVELEVDQVDAEGQQVEQQQAEEPSEEERIKHGLLKRVNKLTEREREAKARAEELERQLAAQQKAQQQDQSLQQPPTLEQFGYDEEKYQVAVHNWNNLRLQREIAVAQRRQEEQREIEARQNEINARREEAKRKADSLQISGYSDAESRVGTVLGESVLNDLLLNSEKPAELVYFLDKNPSDLLELSELIESGQGVKAAMRVGAIESKKFSFKPKASKPEADAIPENTEAASTSLRDKLVKKVAKGEITFAEMQKQRKQ